MDSTGWTDLDAFEAAVALAGINHSETFRLDMDGIRRAGTFASAAGNALLRIDDGNDFRHGSINSIEGKMELQGIRDCKESNLLLK